MSRYILLITICLFLVGCSKEVDETSYIRPMEFDEKEQNIIDILDMQETKLLYDYRVSEDIKVFGFLFETYENGILIEDEILQAGIPEMYQEGKLVIEINNGENFSVKIKNISEDGHTTFSTEIPKLDRLKEAKGFSEIFRTTEYIIRDRKDIILGVYNYDTGSGIRTSSIEQFQNDEIDELSNNLYVLLKLRLLDDFEQ